jgi:cytochrome c biogenesis protein CcdA
MKFIKERKVEMEATKKWYESKTIIASVVTMVLGILSGFGLVGSEATAEADTISNNLVGIITAVSSLIAIYGRVSAKDKVK